MASRLFDLMLIDPLVPAGQLELTENSQMTMAFGPDLVILASSQKLPPVPFRCRLETLEAESQRSGYSGES